MDKYRVPKHIARNWKKYARAGENTYAKFHARYIGVLKGDAERRRLEPLLKENEAKLGKNESRQALKQQALDTNWTAWWHSGNTGRT